MARPHGKTLTGVEGGKPSIHWYEFVETKRKILQSKRWDGGCPVSKNGTAMAIWLGFDPITGKPKWGSIE